MVFHFQLFQLENLRDQWVFVMGLILLEDVGIGFTEYLILRKSVFCDFK